MARTAVFGVFGVENYGNEASLRALLDRYRAAGELDDVVVVCDDPARVAAAHGVRATAMARTDVPRDLPWGRARGKVLDAVRIVGIARACDVVVVPGTGIMEGLWVESGGVPLALFLLTLFAVVRRRPVYLLSIGIDERGSWATRRLFGWTLRLATRVTVRDDRSASAAESLGARRPDIRPDVAFALTDPPVPRATTDTRFVAVGVMDYAGLTVARERGARDAYVTEMVGVVDTLLSAGHPVRVFVGAAPDLKVAREVVRAARAGRPDGAQDVSLSAARSYVEIVDELRDATVMVASRYHNLLAALAAGVPAVALAYGTKQTALLAEFGLDGSFPVDRFDAGEVVERIRKQIVDRDADAGRISRRLARLHTELDEQFAEVLAPGTGVRRFAPRYREERR